MSKVEVTVKFDCTKMEMMLIQRILDREMLDALRLILPLAKGYAAANRVGSNANYITIAENVIARAEERGT